MSNAVEFLYGSRVDAAESFARTKGWRSSGRAAWLKADGTTVYFISLEAQLAAVPSGTKIHRCRWMLGREALAA
jgi:hypothetical protein